MAKIVYLRTDKNGTKYYANYTCPRCGGAGGSDKWAFTGWTCYECGGTGESSTPVIEKEYTPEYRAKLDERARKRAEAKRARQVEEFNNNRLAIAEKYGFNPEGKIYVVTGNTYEIREELREAGAKYRGGINWYFLEKQDRYPTIELSYEECLNIYPEYGTMSWKDLTEVQAVLNSKIPTEEDHSQYVGQEITADQFEPYKHHGSVHKNQIKFKTEETTISATGTKVTVYLEYKDLEQYKEAFLRFVKPFSDTDIEKCWEQVLADDTRVIEFDGFSTETSKFNGNIEYMSIYGFIE